LRNDKVRLRHSDSETGLYACLSHRWGQGEMLVTNTGKLPLFTKDIPWDSIPKTFQAAVTFTLGLGLSYL
jgi:hypothetical protein